VAPLRHDRNARRERAGRPSRTSTPHHAQQRRACCPSPPSEGTWCGACLGQFQDAVAGVFVPSRASARPVGRSNRLVLGVDDVSESVALSLNVLWTKALVTALSAAHGPDSVARIAAHADFAVKHACFCFGEPCHEACDKIPLFNRNRPVWLSSRTRSSSVNREGDPTPRNSP